MYYDAPRQIVLNRNFSDTPAEFRPKNLAIFTDEFGNRIYMKSNCEKVTYNPETKERTVSKFSEKEFSEIMLNIYAKFGY